MNEMRLYVRGIVKDRKNRGLIQMKNCLEVSRKTTKHANQYSPIRSRDSNLLLSCATLLQTKRNRAGIVLMLQKERSKEMRGSQVNVNCR
jgi:hypothetical protein